MTENINHIKIVKSILTLSIIILSLLGFSLTLSYLNNIELRMQIPESNFSAQKTAFANIEHLKSELAEIKQILANNITTQ